MESYYYAAFVIASIDQIDLVISAIKVVISVAVNGVPTSSKEIELVGRTTYLYTSAKLDNLFPVDGVIRDVTVTNSNDMDMGEKNEVKSTILLFLLALIRKGVIIFDLV